MTITQLFLIGHNPKEIAAFSPRLRGTSYLGSSSRQYSQPQRGPQGDVIRIYNFVRLVRDEGK